MPFNTNCPGCGSLGPCGCSGDQCDFVSSDNVKYIGPNLAGTGIQSCDNLTVALQKIDNAIALIEAHQLVQLLVQLVQQLQDLDIILGI